MRQPCDGSLWHHGIFRLATLRQPNPWYILRATFMNAFLVLCDNSLSDDVNDANHAAFALVSWLGSSGCWQPLRVAMSFFSTSPTQIRPPSPAAISWQLCSAASEQAPDLKRTLSRSALAVHLMLGVACTPKLEQRCLHRTEAKRCMSTHAYDHDFT